MIVLQAKEEGHGQILLPSIQMKDTYGTNQRIAFESLWDVEYWNSF
eukprot:CAMPEP_0176137342 /NCGR_PEP_ID=MMETSP0120_2-20121206/69723_1 /TAXON_ID=160619 /ORGANISM="Kryptoperidinium foliaceum, Strain CCMP 1326" /LENGTH=45 /DNA_ID= /DNA_START= /DNA_END= /DNA_ORIENTATION=